MIKIIDVTLRDGGYRTNFFFDQAVIHKVVNELTLSHIDYIEIGYRNGPLKKGSGYGITGITPNDYILSLKHHVPAAKLCVMIHPQNVSFEDLQDLSDCGIEMLRTCISMDNLKSDLRFLETVKRLGFITSANFTHVTSLTTPLLLSAIKSMYGAGADIAYLADSNGNMVPEQLMQLIETIQSVVPITLGFHAHDNLSLALANTVAALRCGITFIDASVCGMGKGSGNLELGTFVAYLTRVGKNNDYNLIKILELEDFVSSSVSNSHLPVSTNHLMLGTFNIPFDYEPIICQVSKESNLSWHSVAYEFGKQSSEDIIHANLGSLEKKLKADRKGKIYEE